MGPQPVGQDDPAVAVELDHFRNAEQRGCQMVALVGVRVETVEKAVDGRDQAVAAGVDGTGIERRIAEHAVAFVLGENGAERSRHRDAALGVDAVRESGHEMVHPPL